jgi:uncharacterized protein (DUF1015 family)
MANIQPFRAIRYNPEQVNVSKVICPPYDVIDDKLAKKLSKQSPYNSIFLSYNVDHKKGEKKYRHIPTLIKDWKKKNILRKDSKPGFYFLEETFTWEGKKQKRRGVFALVPARNNQKIIPHEKVFPQAVSDRLALLKSSKTHVSSIFLVHADPDQKLHRWLKKHKTSQQKLKYPLGKIKYKFGKIDDKTSIRQLQKILSSQSLLIADGHHRFATAQKYARQHRKECYILAFIASASDELPFTYTNALDQILKTKDVTVQKIIQHCKKGKLLPQKSTYFYPKVMSGFVFSELN